MNCEASKVRRKSTNFRSLPRTDEEVKSIASWPEYLMNSSIKQSSQGAVLGSESRTPFSSDCNGKSASFNINRGKNYT